MKNHITDLRNHLFETIEMLKDGDERMDVSKAKAISEASQTIINSAKLEMDFLDKIGGEKTDFIPDQPMLKQVK